MISRLKLRERIRVLPRRAKAIPFLYLLLLRSPSLGNRTTLVADPELEALKVAAAGRAYSPRTPASTGGWILIEHVALLHQTHQTRTTVNLEANKNLPRYRQCLNNHNQLSFL